MSERPEDVLEDFIGNHVHCWHDGHGCGTMECDGKLNPQALAALDELGAMREALERIAGLPVYLTHEGPYIAQKALASLSPPSSNEEGDRE